MSKNQTNEKGSERGRVEERRTSLHRPEVTECGAFQETSNLGSMYMFIDALFTVAKKWNQPRHPSIDELIKETWGIDTKEFYSAIKN